MVSSMCAPAVTSVVKQGEEASAVAASTGVALTWRAVAGVAQEDEGFSATALPGEVDGDAAVRAAKKALAMAASEEADEAGQRHDVIAVLQARLLAVLPPPVVFRTCCVSLSQRPDSSAY